MKLSDIIAAGYQPISFKGATVNAYRINEEFGTLIITTDEGTRHIALTKQHTDFEIEFIMVSRFNEDTAAAMMLAGAAPVLMDDILPDYKQQLDRHEDRRKRDHGERVTRRDPRGLF